MQVNKGELLERHFEDGWELLYTFTKILVSHKPCIAGKLFARIGKKLGGGRSWSRQVDCLHGSDHARSDHSSRGSWLILCEFRLGR